MTRPGDRDAVDRGPDRTPAEHADARDLRAVISDCLSSQSIDENALRAAVWTYVGGERHVGTSPGHVIIALTKLVDAAGVSPASVKHALHRRVILWCIEAYFGHLGGDVGGRDDHALGDSHDAMAAT